MKIGLIINMTRDIDLKVTRKVVAILQSLQVKVVIDPIHHGAIIKSLPNIEYTDYADCRLIISIGGDGTLLSAAHLTSAWNLPIAGINLGSLGFMMDIDVDSIAEDLPQIIDGNYVIDERMQLQVTCFSAEGKKKFVDFAVNDAVFNRAPTSPIQSYQLSINNQVVETIPGDGLIISTPTGSTGYAMAAGGPIIDPKLKAILFTPLCPHTLHNRNYVLAADSQLKIALLNPRSKPFLSVDGRSAIMLEKDDEVLIKKCDKSLKLISLVHKNFYTKVPEKIQKRSLGI